MDTSRIRRRLCDYFRYLQEIEEQLLTRKPMARGTVYELQRKCGKKGCRCTRGKLHKQMCIAITRKGKQIRNQTCREIEDNTIRKLSWRMAQRDDNKVAKEIHEKKEVDSIYNLEDSGLLDEFYAWLEKEKVIEILKKISPAGVDRVMVPFFSVCPALFLEDPVGGGINEQSAQSSILQLCRYETGGI